MTDLENSLERALIARAWRDPAFARSLQIDPRSAFVAMGIDVSADVELEVIVQDRDTLYYVVPPLAGATGSDAIINQMDLWQSAELFCWIMPQDLKLELLGMRQSFRRNNA